MKRIRKATIQENIEYGELETFRRLITEVYPNGFVSIVSDTWDFWKVMSEYTVALKEEILARDGRVVFRPDCYSSDTKIMTKEGWKFFFDLKPEEEVIQVLDNGTMEFTKYTNFVSQNYNGDMYHFTDEKRKLDMLVTPNHRMVYSKNNQFGVQLAEDFASYYDKDFLRSVPYKSYGRKLTSDEKLKIAFQADGSFTTTGNKIRFSFSKQRKIERLQSILNECEYDYKIYNLNDGRVEFNIKVDASKYQKDFEWVDISNLCSNWCKEFIEELSYWDATRRDDGRFKFDTTVKSVIEKVEYISIFAGYGVLISETEDNRKDTFSIVYTAHILKNNHIGGQSIKKTKLEYEGNIYCVTVPSGRLLVKRNNSILVCGNSGDPVDIICGFTKPDTLNRNPIDAKKYNASDEEVKGAYELLWDIFGGTINEKGFKVLNPKVGIIYGDSITLERQKEIYKRLEAKGFCASNLVLGVGSFTYQYKTRDSLGFAMKATWCQINGQEVEIFKQPKTDDGTKNSLKGLISVFYDDYMQLTAYDQVDKDAEGKCELITVFEDGKLVKEYSLSEIRNTINKSL